MNLFPQKNSEETQVGQVWWIFLQADLGPYLQTQCPNSEPTLTSVTPEANSKRKLTGVYKNTREL